MKCVPDKKTFLEKAKQGNLIPVYRELLADRESPVSVYERLRNALRKKNPTVNTFLLESVEGGSHVARYSFLGGDPQVLIRGNDRTVEVEQRDGKKEIFRDVEPLSIIKKFMAKYKPVPDPALPRFFGGAVGYLCYDAVAQFEKRVPLHKNKDLPGPDLLFIITDTILIFDHVRHSMKVVANALVEGDAEKAYDEAIRRIETLCEAISAPTSNSLIELADHVEPSKCSSNLTREEFIEAVQKSKEYIRAGDVIQVVLSQRFQVDYKGDPLNVYRAVRHVNPSPYMYCLELDGRAVVGSSPEIHVRCEEGKVELRPIAGTRPRSENTEQDEALARELLADPKERAEHIMLVDLARNDLGRVCKIGSVKVRDLMVIERYSHVMHIVSDVVGEIDPSHDAYDLMRATFPAGTVSGAPKIRAMEIIAGLEKNRRGTYAGAVGYFSFTGNLDSCITIRTAFLDGKHAYVQAGAGIVADSDPQKEFEESCNKARGMLMALSMAQRYDAAKQGGLT